MGKFLRYVSWRNREAIRREAKPGPRLLGWPLWSPVSSCVKSDRPGRPPTISSRSLILSDAPLVKAAASGRASAVIVDTRGQGQVGRVKGQTSLWPRRPLRPQAAPAEGTSPPHGLPTSACLIPNLVWSWWGDGTGEGSTLERLRGGIPGPLRPWGVE